MTAPVAKLGRHPLARFLLSDVPDGTAIEPVNIIAEDGVASTGLLYVPRGPRPSTAVHLMHPRTDQSQHYTIPALLRAGYAVLGRAGRWVNNDVVTQHEHLLLDIGAAMRYLREERGFDAVVMLGNSGGGSLSAFYQSQALKTPAGRITATPAGDPIGLAEAHLPPADAMVFLAAHPGQGRFLARCLDPSVIDESDLLAADARLDMYDPANGFASPPDASTYSAEFTALYRAGQQARLARIDALARSRIDARRHARAVIDDPAFARLHGSARERWLRAAHASWYLVIYRTAADLRFTDLSIDPDDRIVASLMTNQPQRDNYAEAGFAHYLTPEAWLSTWSGNTSRAALADTAGDITQPALVVHYAADAGVSMTDMRDLGERLQSADKSVHAVANASHYGMSIVDGRETSQRNTEGLDLICDWLLQRFQP